MLVSYLRVYPRLHVRHELAQAFSVRHPCKIRHLPLDFHCNPGVNKQYLRKPYGYQWETLLTMPICSSSWATDSAADVKSLVFSGERRIESRPAELPYVMSRGEADSLSQAFPL